MQNIKIVLFRIQKLIMYASLHFYRVSFVGCRWFCYIEVKKYLYLNKVLFFAFRQFVTWPALMSFATFKFYIVDVFVRKAFQFILVFIVIVMQNFYLIILHETCVFYLYLIKKAIIKGSTSKYFPNNFDSKLKYEVCSENNRILFF